MTYELIELGIVYDGIKNAYPDISVPPPLPEREDSPYKRYRKSYTPLIRNVVGNNAVYLWFSHHKEGNLEYIYVGETHINKQGLKGRFKDEFRRWHHGFWASTFHTEKYLPEAIRIYSNVEKYKPKKGYAGDIETNFSKRGATYLVYCTNVPVEYDVIVIQNDLIQLFENPRGNEKDKRVVPLPEEQLLPISKIIHKTFIEIASNTRPHII